MCNILHGSGDIHPWRSVKEGAGHVFATAHGAIAQWNYSPYCCKGMEFYVFSLLSLVQWLCFICHASVILYYVRTRLNLVSHYWTSRALIVVSGNCSVAGFCNHCWVSPKDRLVICSGTSCHRAHNFLTQGMDLCTSQYIKLFPRIRLCLYIVLIDGNSETESSEYFAGRLGHVCCCGDWFCAEYCEW